jgi:hypothetical protein
MAESFVIAAASATGYELALVLACPIFTAPARRRVVEIGGSASSGVRRAE